jgi:hypothetical protein
MKWRRFVRSNRAQSATCFCVGCATVAHCDAGRRIAAVRDDALTHALLRR